MPPAIQHKMTVSAEAFSFGSSLANAGKAAAPSAAVEPFKKLRRLSSIFM